MNDSVVTVRMPKGLVEDLNKLIEKQHYMDLSEAIRSILRKEYLKSNFKNEVREFEK